MAQATTTETPARRAVRSPLALIEAVALSRVSQVQPEGTKLLALTKNSTVCPGEVAVVSGVRVTAEAKSDAGTLTTRDGRAAEARSVREAGPHLERTGLERLVLQLAAYNDRRVIRSEADGDWKRRSRSRVTGAAL